jgi:hypothetical protein
MTRAEGIAGQLNCTYNMCIIARLCTDVKRRLFLASRKVFDYNTGRGFNRRKGHN